MYINAAISDLFFNCGEVEDYSLPAVTEKARAFLSAYGEALVEQPTPEELAADFLDRL